MVVLSEHCNFDQITVTHAGTEIILVRDGACVYGYRNSCPHLGIGLDWGDGRCLDESGELVCAMHGARFQPHTGLCTAGPCAGEHLRTVPVRIDGGRVVLDA